MRKFFRKSILSGLMSGVMVLGCNPLGADKMRYGVMNPVGLSAKSFHEHQKKISTLVSTVAYGEEGSLSLRDIARKGEIFIGQSEGEWFLNEAEDVSLSLRWGGGFFRTKARGNLITKGMPLDVRIKTRGEVYVATGGIGLNYYPKIDKKDKGIFTDIDVNLGIGIDGYYYNLRSNSAISVFGVKLYDLKMNRESYGFSGFGRIGIEHKPKFFSEGWGASLGIEYHFNLYDASDATGTRAVFSLVKEF